MKAARAIGLLGLGAALVAAEAWADQDPRVLALDSRPLGKSYAEWALEWARWSFSLPASLNPAVDASDPTGMRCALGQRAAVWFLAGTWRGGTAQRLCYLPTGTLIFVPVLVNSSVRSAFDPPQDKLYERIQRTIDHAQVAVELDGKPIERLRSYRVRGPPGAGVLPPGSLFAEQSPAAEMTTEILTTGVFLMFAPLAVGPHVLHIHAEVAEENVVLDVRYELQVEVFAPRPLGRPVGVPAAARRSR